MAHISTADKAMTTKLEYDTQMKPYKVNNIATTFGSQNPSRWPRFVHSFPGGKKWSLVAQRGQELSLMVKWPQWTGVVPAAQVWSL